jgi:hypothetical protein
MQTDVMFPLPTKKDSPGLLRGKRHQTAEDGTQVEPEEEQGADLAPEDHHSLEATQDQQSDEEPKRRRGSQDSSVSQSSSAEGSPSSNFDQDGITRRRPGRPRRAQRPQTYNVEDPSFVQTEEERKGALRQSKRRNSVSSTGSAAVESLKDSDPAARVKPKTGKIDFKRFDLASLKRYKRVYKVRVKPGSGKFQLIQAIQEHNRSVQVDEADVISRFLSRIHEEQVFTDSHR